MDKTQSGVTSKLHQYCRTVTVAMWRAKVQLTSVVVFALLMLAIALTSGGNSQTPTGGAIDHIVQHSGVVFADGQDPTPTPTPDCREGGSGGGGGEPDRFRCNPNGGGGGGYGDPKGG